MKPKKFKPVPVPDKDIRHFSCKHSGIVVSQDFRGKPDACWSFSDKTGHSICTEKEAIFIASALMELERRRAGYKPNTNDYTFNTYDPSIDP